MRPLENQQALTAATVQLVEGVVRVKAVGPTTINGLAAPLDVFELLGTSGRRWRASGPHSREPKARFTNMCRR